MTDEALMRECLRLARRGAGRVSPNPMVGALLVRKGRILARGYHRRFGGPHAEIDCLSRFSGSFRGTTLYVNLEPCSHQGKTPPCARAIVESGIPEVVVAMQDPNPLVAGRGIRLLRRAGVRVRLGVLENEARELNRVFVHHITRRRPFIHVKVAQSLDGYIAPRTARKYWLTGRESKALVHRWRAECDAILVGAGTIAADNPRLTARLARGRNPVVVILDGKLTVSPEARVFRTGSRVVLLAAERSIVGNERKLATLACTGCVVFGLKGIGSRIDIKTIARTLYRHGLMSILVEGGSSVFSQFARSGLVDRLSVLIAPVLLGDGIPAFASGTGSGSSQGRRIRLSARRVGVDMLVESIAE